MGARPRQVKVVVDHRSQLGAPLRPLALNMRLLHNHHVGSNCPPSDSSYPRDHADEFCADTHSTLVSETECTLTTAWTYKSAVSLHGANYEERAEKGKGKPKAGA